MFNAYAKGLTSIRNLVEYAKSIHLQHRNGHPLTRSQIQLMLHNPFYYGEMKVKGKLYPHIYEPLISKELFNICNKITTTRHCESTSKSKDSFLLSGFVRCKYCGNLYSPYKSKGKYAFLQPPVNRNCKHHHNLSESMVIAVINEQLAQLKMGKNKKAHLLKVIENKYQQELQKRTENILKLDSELSHMKHKEKRLVDLLISDKISQEMFEQTSKEIELEKKDIQDKIARYDIRIEEFFSNMKKIVKIAEISQKMFKSSSFLKKRAILKTITSNFFTDGKNAVISIRKPFEICLQRVSCPTWLEITRTYRVENPEEFTSLGRICEIFLKDWEVTP